MIVVPQRALRMVLNAWRARGWRDHDDAALRVVGAAEAEGGFSEALAEAVPDGFLTVNGVRREEVARELLTALGDVRIGTPGLLIAPQTIDSFANAASVSPKDVRGLGGRLELPEATVKRCILHILGESEIPKDWGGERDDIFSTRVRLGGRPVNASFALKGAGTRGRLTPAKLGKHGDQITRMVTQPAELFVVQYIGPIEPSVHEQLRHAIRSLRAQGNSAVGSVCDGIETARILIASGLLDAAAGTLTSAGRDVAGA